MLRPSKDDSLKSFFFSLRDSLDQRHPLYILVHRVDWDMFDRASSKFYSANQGAPAKLIRLIVGLLILKHIRNLSDENPIEQ